MRTRQYEMRSTYGWLVGLAGILAASQLQSAVADDTPTETSVVTATVQTDSGGGASGATSATASGGGGVVVKDIEPLAEDAPPPRRTRSWLGVGVAEAPEALSSQLNLAPGVGLVVTYVTPDSPAAKAGLEENDLLVEFERQPLVVPAQLRKLVQVRKEGDKVELAYYRGGKKQTVTVTLGKAPPGYGLLEDGEALKGDLADLSQQFKVLPMGQAWRDALNAYRDQMGHFKIDQVKMQEEVRRSVEQARRAMEEAMRYSTNMASEATSKALRELKNLGFTVDTGSSVTVRSSGDRVQKHRQGRRVRHDCDRQQSQTSSHRA